MRCASGPLRNPRTTTLTVIVSSVTILTREQGASTYIAAAFDPALEGKVHRRLRGRKANPMIVSNGAYLEYCKPVPIKEECPWARGMGNVDKLWALSEDSIGEKFH